MDLYITKLNEKYIFHGKYEDRLIPKNHKFNWDPDNRHWYTYESYIAHILLKCLLHPLQCTHKGKNYLKYQYPAQYPATNVDYSGSMGGDLSGTYPNPIYSPNNIDLYLDDEYKLAAIKIANMIEEDNKTMKKKSKEKEQVDEKIAIPKRKIILE